jgi:hypothetical protein
VEGGRRKLHKEELHNSYATPNIIKVMRRAGNVEHMGEMKNVYKILVRKPERKRPLRRPRHR